MSHSPIMLTQEQIDTFWDSIILDALTAEERDSGFSWIQNIRNSQQYQALSGEATQYIFEKKVPALDFTTLTSRGFFFFEYFFRYVNWNNKAFDQTDTGVGDTATHLLLHFL